MATADRLSTAAGGDPLAEERQPLFGLAGWGRTDATDMYRVGKLVGRWATARTQPIWPGCSEKARRACSGRRIRGRGNSAAGRLAGPRVFRPARRVRSLASKRSVDEPLAHSRP